MAFKLSDRVQETTATSGTGSLALHGAVAGFQSFASTLSVGDTTYYAIFDMVALTWEIGLGTFGSGNTLGRTTVLASSNGGSKIALAGNAGTQVQQDMPASVLAALIAAQGTIKSVTDGSHTVTNPGTISFTGATVSNVGGGASVSIASSGSALDVTDGVTSVTNATTIDFTANATVTNLGGGVAGVAISGGGGGGSYTGAVGIYVTPGSPGTIGNTGTINLVAPAGSANGNGIILTSAPPGPSGTSSGNNYFNTAPVTADGVTIAPTSGNGGIYVGLVTLTDPLGSGVAGLGALGGGNVTNGTIFANGVAINAGGAQIQAGTAAGGGIGVFSSGGAYYAPILNRAGDFTVQGANAYGGETAEAGSVILNPGFASGASMTNTNGGLIINNLDTVDPHVLNQAWLGVGNGTTLSSG